MLELPKMSIRLRAVSEFHCSYGYNATHSGSHRFIPRMNIEVSGSCHIGVAQQARYRCDVDAVFDSACRKRVSLRYNYDKPEKPSVFKGFSVCRCLFNSFSNLDSQRKICRMMGGVT